MKKENTELTEYKITELKEGFNDMSDRFDKIDNKIDDIYSFIITSKVELEAAKESAMGAHKRIDVVERGIWGGMVLILMGVAAFFWDTFTKYIFNK